MSTIRDLLSVVPQTGRVDRVLLRPARREEPVEVDVVEAVVGSGLHGDRQRAGRYRVADRQVTLVQAEHLVVIASLVGRRSPVDAALLRRNLVVRGVPLLALAGLRFAVGDVVLQGTGACHPCSRMEEVLGPGGYQAMRGHGGITAAVVAPGRIRVGDPVAALSG